MLCHGASIELDILSGDQTVTPESGTTTNESEGENSRHELTKLPWLIGVICCTI